MVRTCFLLNRPYKDSPTRDSQRKLQTRKTVKEVGGQHSRMDKNELCRVPESGGGQRQMRESGDYVITGALKNISRSCRIEEEEEEVLDNYPVEEG